MYNYVCMYLYKFINYFLKNDSAIKLRGTGGGIAKEKMYNSDCEPIETD